MPWSESFCWWLVCSAVASLAISAFGGVAMLLCRQPTRRLRIIEVSLAACLVAPLLGLIPGYPRLAIARPAVKTDLATARSTDSPVMPSMAEASPVISGENLRRVQDDGSRIDHSSLISSPSISLPAQRIPKPKHPIPGPSQPTGRDWNVGSWLVALYALGVAVGVAWWLLGVAALVRVVWTARAAPPRCRRLLAEISGRRNARVRLLTSRRAKQPFACNWGLTRLSFGENGTVPLARRLLSQRLMRAVIVLPDSLCDDEQAIRWALAHEWSHIERGDFRAWFVAGLARVLFFYQPLVWWLRRQLRLCQDYVADARASREASQPEDYAEFLTVRAAAGSLHPAMVGLGMGFRKSELYRRIVMLVQNQPLESRPPRLWSVSVTCVAMFLIAAVATLTVSPQAVAQGEKKPTEGVVKEAKSGVDQSQADKADPSKDKPQVQKSDAGTTTTGKFGFTTTLVGEPENDEELDKLIKEKKYEFVKTFDSNSGEKQYVYSLNYPDGRRVGRNFSMPLEKVTSWADYRQKEGQLRQQRQERIDRAIAAGRFRLLDLEVMQVHICRDAESGNKFKIQRIQLPDRTEIAFPRADFGKIPPSVKKTSWQEHLQAIRDGKRQLLELETVNSYTYEMTADDGTKDIFNYGGNEPLEVIAKRSASDNPKQELYTAKPKTTTDQVIVEDLALEMLVAIREKKDDALKTLAVDRNKGWRDALPHFALECRERFTQNTGKSFVMYPVESLVEGDLAVVKCARPKEIPGNVCLVLYFVKTANGWRNWMLRNSPPNKPLSEFLKEKP